MGLVRHGRPRRSPSRRRRLDERGRRVRVALSAVVGLALVVLAFAAREPAPRATPVVSPRPTPTASPRPTPTASPRPTPTASRRPTPTASRRPTPSAAPACHPNYSPCAPIASDVDCAGGRGNGPAYVVGPVRVIGDDVYGLDGDHDGVACEP